MEVVRGRASSIPRFSPTSLTTPRVRWLHEETWDDAQKASYQRLRLAPSAGAYTPPPFVRNRRAEAPFLVGRWLLEWADGTPVAAAEAQAQMTKFRSITLFISAAPWDAGEAKAALTLLVSGLIILTAADRMRLLPLSEAGGEALVKAEVGTASELWTPLATMARTTRGGLRLTAIAVDCVAWWTSAHGAADRRTLAYLEKRLELEAERAALRAAAKKQSAKPRLGLARAFRLLLGRR